MNVAPIGRLLAAPLLGLALAGAAQAAGTESTPAANARIDDFTAGRNAIAAKNWAEAVAHFNKVVAQNPGNADAYNLLGFSYRWLDRYDEAFSAYGRALALDPNHKGALHYSGIAYLKTQQRARAEANLARLQAICARCEETGQLARAIADSPTASK